MAFSSTGCTAKHNMALEPGHAHLLAPCVLVSDEDDCCQLAIADGLFTFCKLLRWKKLRV